MPLVARLTLDPALRIATFILVAITAVVLGRLSWALIEPSSILPTATAASTQPMPTTSSNGAQGSFRELAGLSIFGASKNGNSSAVHAPDTTLSWVLKGVLSDRDPARSSAILSPQGQSEKLYRVGASLPGNVRLEQILSDRVILARDGKLETLRLKRETAGAGGKKAPPRAKPGATNATLTPDGGVATIDREAWANDPQRFLEVISASPVMQDGEMYGLEVNPGRQVAEFEAAGLQPGDVILAVEGTMVSEIQDYRDILKELGGSSSVSVSLERNGQPTEITITMD